MEHLVIKCGGSIMENLPLSFYQNIVELMHDHKVKPIVVHGGGPEISSLLSKLDIPTAFINGLRITTDEVLDIAEMVLSGKVNKLLVRKIIQCGGKAAGLSGVDGLLLKAKPMKSDINLGYVGDIVSVNINLLYSLMEQNIIPIISPIAIDESGQRWNINGDVAAGAIAKELQASLCMITNVSGVMKDGQLLHKLTGFEAERLIDKKIISGGMIPKVHTALECLRAGIKQVAILNGMEENALKNFAFGLQAGTVFFTGSLKA